MSTVFFLLIAILMLGSLLALWSLLAMASWSDRQLARAWEEWQAGEAGASASREQRSLLSASVKHLPRI